MTTYSRNGIHDPRSHSLESPFFKRNGYTETPVVIQCFLTLRCGMSCEHCLAVHAASEAGDMPMPLFEKLCREAADLGVDEMILTGGEPLRCDRIQERIACLRRHGLSWTLNTAEDPDEDQRDAILGYPPGFVAVSLDGPSSIHNAFRGSETAFERAMASIRFFSGIPGIAVCAGTTITTHNIAAFNDTFELVRKSGAHRWGIHLLLPEGLAENRKDLFPSAARMKTLLEKIAQTRTSFPVSLCDEMGYAGEWESLVRDNAFFCAAGRAMCAVLPNGSVMPCSTLNPRHCEGNLNQSALADIWQRGFKAQRSPRREGKCAQCPDGALCGSGCWLQRTHGTQCFKPLWKVPRAIKAAASMAVCLSGLNGCATHDDLPHSLSAEVRNPAAPSTQTEEIRMDSPPKPQFIMKGLFASKSGGELRMRAQRDSRLPLQQMEQAIRLSLQWLKANRNEDGTWGEPEHRSFLTALVIRASARSIRVMANEPDDISDSALSILYEMRDIPECDQADSRNTAALVWCFADVGGTFGSPKFINLAESIVSRVDLEPITPWKIFARLEYSKFCFSRSEWVPRLERLLEECRKTEAPDFLQQTEMSLVAMYLQKPELFRPLLADLFKQTPDRWKSSTDPMLCALMISRICYLTTGSEWEGWSVHFAEETVRKQTVRDTVGWWDAASWDIPKRNGMKGMSRRDARIYVTAMTILSLDATWQDASAIRFERIRMQPEGSSKPSSPQR